jgi:uncharacterized protein YkwD
MILLVAGRLFSQDAGTNWSQLQALDAAETRLPEYRDSPEVLQLKLKMLAVINASRQQYHAPPVQLDILASRVANKQSLEAAKNDFHGHWNLAGEKPYVRYGAAGGVDHVSENASAIWSSVALDPGKLLDYMVESHQSFMSEQAPNDGHKRNDINAVHTHVGIGVALVGGQFRYYEEFLDRYFDKIECPTQVTAGQTFTVHAVPAKGLFCYLLVAYFEPFPQPMTATEINAHYSYGDYTNETALTVWPPSLNTAPDGSISLELSFKKPGLYYVQIYLDKTPPAKTGRFDADGKVQASGLVVRVQ